MTLEYSTEDKFVLELGIDTDGQRLCVMEVGPYDTILQAALQAETFRNSYVAHVPTMLLPGVGWEWYDGSSEHNNYVIVGATLNVYTDLYGTSANYDLY